MHRRSSRRGLSGRIWVTVAATLAVGTCTTAIAVPGAHAQLVPQESGAAPAVPIDNPRPTSCPAVPSNQGGPDSEHQTAAGTVPWPALPSGVDPEDYAALDHTAAVQGQPPVRPANWNNDEGNIKLTSARSTDPLVSD